MKNKILTGLFFLSIFLPLVSFSQITINDGEQVKIYNGSRVNVTGDALVESGGILIISGEMDVSGVFTNNDVTNSAAITITSNATETGSLIFASGTPAATVERYIPHTSAWNMVSPSTTDVSGQNFYDAAGGSSSWLTKFYEPTGTGQDLGAGWLYITKLDSVFTLGTGLLYWPAAADETVEFKGNLQDGDLTLSPLSYTSASHGFNLIGNPFSSALYWDGTWQKTSMEGTIWIWDGSNYQASPGDLATINIPVGQGFFVRATNTDAVIEIPAAKRVHNTQAFLKSSKNIISNEYNSLTIKAINNSYEDNVHISFGDNGT
ncbi:MAG: hypothetical protein C0595_14275, partial [Marinilabiliales bacterium]